jgi:excinuclease ABC subunit C
MELINDIIKSISSSPGVYQFKDDNGHIIYIGKAKDLRKRVSSYFNKKKFENNKTKVLVKKIADIKTIKVESEMDALLLENVLIKKHQPKYNVQLKDDKTYPWICVKNEPFPRINYTRKVIKDGSKYFGPYHSVTLVKYIINFLNNTFHLRNCSHELKKWIPGDKKYKSEVEYYIGNCKGCCQGEVQEEDYNQRISSAIHVLKGNISNLVKELKKEMKVLSVKFKYEEAQLIKNTIKELENYQAKSAVVSSTITNVDVFSIEEDQSHAFVNYLKVVNGAICQSRMIEIKKKLEEDKNGLLEMVVVDVLQAAPEEIKELILPFKLESKFKHKVSIPQKGDRKKLLDLSQRNAYLYMKEKHKNESVKNPEKHTERILKTIKEDLKLNEIPERMECFDNSNFQGNEPVAACVVFNNAKPAKKEYRHYNIKTVVGPDDFASMEEVVYRRYKRLIDEEKPLPQLIVLDGGKGQLSSAIKSLESLGIKGKVAVIAIAKKLEEIFYPGDKYPLYLDKKSETLRVIQHMRNEAHRFGIKHHRSKRIKSTLQSELTSIKGVGPKTMIHLIKKYKSIKSIKTLTLEELANEIGSSKAKIIFENIIKKEGNK